MYIKLVLSLLTIGSTYFYVNSYDKELSPERFRSNYTLQIELIESIVIENNRIGDDWSFNSKIEDTELKIGNIYNIALNGKSSIEIYSEAIEDDPNHDDIGISTIAITPTNLEEIVDLGIIKSIVKVHEHHGPSAGKTATCEFTYRIKLDITISNLAAK